MALDRDVACGAGGMNDPATVLTMARAAQVRLATAESCTGGLLAASLTAIPGASDVVVGGIVAYSNTVKRQVLGVHGETLAAHGAVCEEVAREMAEGALRALPEAHMAVAITGIAGPGGGTETKPEGRVCFGLARTCLHTESAPPKVCALSVDFGALGRANVRRMACDKALDMLLAALRGAA